MIMYGSDVSLREMVRSDPASFPAKNARRLSPRMILDRGTKVTLGWLMHQVAREEVDPHDAAWALCPPVEPMTSGFVKLIGHTELVFRNWVTFFRENGPDMEEEIRVKQNILKIWGRKEDTPCRLLPKKS